MYNDTISPRVVMITRKGNNDLQIAAQRRQQWRKAKRLIASHKDGNHEVPVVTCPACRLLHKRVA